jgi:hypothetical protein
MNLANEFNFIRVMAGRKRGEDLPKKIGGTEQGRCLWWLYKNRDNGDLGKSICKIHDFLKDKANDQGAKEIVFVCVADIIRHVNGAHVSNDWMLHFTNRIWEAEQLVDNASHMAKHKGFGSKNLLAD